MKLKIKKQNPHAYLPTKGTKSSVGWDLYVPDKFIYINYDGIPVRGNKNVYRAKKFHLWRQDVKFIDLGIAIEIPEGYWGEMIIRSSLGKQGLCLANGVGVIDSDYRGTLKAMIVNNGTQERIIMPGDRIAQLIIHKVHNIEIEESDDLSDTDRGIRGLGSTGK